MVVMSDSGVGECCGWSCRDGSVANYLGAALHVAEWDIGDAGVSGKRRIRVDCEQRRDTACAEFCSVLYCY